MALIETVNLEITTNADKAAKSIDRLALSISRLNAAVNPTVGKLTALNAQLRSMSGSGKAITSLSGRIRTLNTNAAKLTQTNRNLKNLKGAAANIPTVAGAPTARATGAGTQQAAAQMRQYTAAARSAQAPTMSLTSLFGKFGGRIMGVIAGFYALQRAIRFFGMILKSTIGRAMHYIEVSNLFQVAMRKNITEAEAFTKTMSEALGLDPARLKEMQATFFQISESMGLTNRSAYALSEILTRLGMDFASLRDISLDQIFVKMESAIVGEARAVRRLGQDITQQALQETALRVGITKRVKSMTQAEKGVLRLITLYNQSTIAQGDMARTLTQPANLMRVLGDQFAITARAIGALFIPMLQKVIPYVIYFVRAIGIAVTRLGQLLGIDMEKMGKESAKLVQEPMDYGDMAADMGDTAKNAKSAAKSMKKMKDYTLGFDELNILQPEKAETPSGGGGGGAGAGGEMNLDDLLEELRRKMAELMTKPFEEMMERIRKRLQPYIDALMPFVKTWSKNFKNLWAVLKPILKKIGELFSVLWVKWIRPILSYIMVMNDKGWDVIVGTIKVAWEFIEPVFDMWIWYLDKLGDVFRFVLDFIVAQLKKADITGMFDQIVKGIRIAKDVIVTVLGKMGEAFQIGIRPIVDFVRTMIYQIADRMQPIVATAIGLIKAGIRTIWDTFVTIGQAIITFASGGWKTAFDNIKTAATGKLSPIVNAVGAIWTKFNTLKDSLSKFANGGWLNALNLIKSVWDNTVGKIKVPTFDNLKTQLKSFINAIIRLVKNFAISINGLIFKIPKAIRDKFGIKPIDHSGLQYLARGGSPSTGSMFVAGEQGAELVGSFGGNKSTVMPLENSGFVSAMAKAVYSAVSMAMNDAESGGTGDIYMDGEKVGRIIREGERRSGIQTALVRSI